MFYIKIHKHVLHEQLYFFNFSLFVIFKKNKIDNILIGDAREEK